MKKIISLSLVVILVLSLCGCEKLADRDKIHHIENLLDNEEYKQALSYSQEYVRAYPNDYYGRALVGKTFYYNDEYDLAIEHLKKSIELRPEYILSHYYLVYIYMYTGQNDLCIEYGLKALELNENFDGILKSLTTALLAKKRLDEVIMYGERCWAVTSEKDSSTAVDLAIAYFYKGNQRQSEFYFKIAEEMGDVNVQLIKDLYSGECEYDFEED